MKTYHITLLKGDGIGPEIVGEAVKVLDKAAEKFGFQVAYEEALLGGCAIDAAGVPLPQETVDKCKAGRDAAGGCGRPKVGYPTGQFKAGGRAFGHPRSAGAVCKPPSRRYF